MKNSPFKNGLSQGLGIFLAIATLGVITAFAANWYDSYIFTTGEVLSATKLNAIVKATVPTGFIGAFNSDTGCPDGWILANGTNSTNKVGGGSNAIDLRGRFLRGIDSTGVNDTIRTLGDYQADDFKSHNHAFKFMADSSTAGGSPVTAIGVSTRVNASFMSIASGYGIGDTGGTETRPKNVAVLYCVKQ